MSPGQPTEKESQAVRHFGLLTRMLESVVYTHMPEGEAPHRHACFKEDPSTNQFCTCTGLYKSYKMRNGGKRLTLVRDTCKAVNASYTAWMVSPQPKDM
jgi:hypothetical protein